LEAPLGGLRRRRPACSRYRRNRPSRPSRGSLQEHLDGVEQQHLSVAVAAEEDSRYYSRWPECAITRGGRRNGCYPTPPPRALCSSSSCCTVHCLFVGTRVLAQRHERRRHRPRVRVGQLRLYLGGQMTALVPGNSCSTGKRRGIPSRKPSELSSTGLAADQRRRLRTKARGPGPATAIIGP
jgi:hypothetical protein